MCWKPIRRILLGCCGGRKSSSDDNDAYNLPDDLSDPRNQAVLPRPTSGCRGALEIKDDGKVVDIEYEDTETLSPASDNDDPAENLANSAGHSSETIQEAVIHENLERFLADRRADDKSSTEGSTHDDRGEQTPSTDTEMSSQLAKLSIQSSTDENVITTSDDSGSALINENLARILADTRADDKSSTERSHHDDRSEQTPSPDTEMSSLLAKFSIQSSADENVSTTSDDSASGHSELQSPQTLPRHHRPILVATRKRKLPNNTGATSHEIVATTSKKDSSPTKTTKNEMDSDTVSSPLFDFEVPQLSKNPKAYCALLRNLCDQLVPYLNPHDPDIVRPYDFEKDGCFCEHIIPLITEDETAPTPTITTVDPLDSPPRPVVSLPPPQTPVRPYSSKYPRAISPIEDKSHDAFQKIN